MKLRSFLNILTLGLTLVVNFLANYLPLNGVSTGEVSDSFPVLFTPAGYVFSIWGIIYLLLIAFTIYQALPSQQNNQRLERVGYLFVVANILNSVWIFLWHYNLIPLTVVVMLGLLVTLIAIYQRLRIGRETVSRIERFLVDMPFSVYLGWITVATVANTSVFLFDLGWNGTPFGPQPWTVFMILIAAGLGGLMIWLRRETAYPLVLIWAFIGIAVKQSAYMPVVVTALAAAGALAVFLAAQRFSLTRKQRLSPSFNQ